MITPQGQSANHIEKLMLLSMWANWLDQQSNNSSLKSKIIHAGLGKPTYPLNSSTIKAHKEYWEGLETSVNSWHSAPDTSHECAIGYVDPYGDQQAKSLMAKAMSKWYKSDISEKNILFTVGGIGGLRHIFDVLNSFYAKEGNYRVITPFPHYSAYANNPHHMLHSIDVMSKPGYQLTARELKKSIGQAYRLAKIDGCYPKAILICNPSNPLGTTIKEDEFKKIAHIIEQFPDLILIIDEAYTEMCFQGTFSVLTHLESLKKRTIILRSATKALSAAGERMAVLLAFDDFLMNELIREQITSYIHPPRSAQIAYAKTMLYFSDKDSQAMSFYYQKKVEYVLNRLKKMGAEMACPHYQVSATFYALGDFSDLMGLELPQEVENILNKKGIVQTGEDLAYYLLFKDSLMLAPLSYFGLAKDCGILRITCSAKPEELTEMMDRLENRLFQSRLIKNQFLVNKVQSTIYTSKISISLKQKIIKRLEAVELSNPTCRTLKLQNQELTNLFHS